MADDKFFKELKSAYTEATKDSLPFTDYRDVLDQVMKEQLDREVNPQVPFLLPSPDSSFPQN